MIEDSRRGWRRVVASPRPLGIVEEGVVRRLLEAGVVVVTVGGGGIPVVADGVQLDGVEAVVDKDYATAVLAVALDAERVILVTDVDAVYRDYGSPSAAPISHLDADEAARMAATLPRGSMGSKLEAAVDFVRRRGGAGEAIITRPQDLLLAAAGRAGTRIAEPRA